MILLSVIILENHFCIQISCLMLTSRRRSILHKCLVIFSLFLTNFYYFLFLFFAFRKLISLFQWVLRFLCQIFCSLLKHIQNVLIFVLILYLQFVASILAITTADNQSSCVFTIHIYPIFISFLTNICSTFRSIFCLSDIKPQSSEYSEFLGLCPAILPCSN